MSERMEKARHLVEKVGELPPIPAVILKALELLNDPSATVKKIQQQIMMDQALTAFLLKVANSALYGTQNEVSTVSYAINLMGYNAARSILMAFMTKNFYSAGSKMIQTVLWKHSVSSAIFARKIGEHVKRVNIEEAFISALLHDIGKGVLLKNKTSEFGEIIEKIFNENALSIDIEQKTLGYTHLEVGYLLMKKWNFSDRIVESLIYHHAPLDYSGDNLLVPITSLANKLSHLNDFDFSKWFEGWELDIIELSILKIQPQDLEEISKKALVEIEEILKVLEF